MSKKEDQWDYYTTPKPDKPSCPKCGGTHTAVRFLATLRGYACLGCKHRWSKDEPNQKTTTTP